MSSTGATTISRPGSKPRMVPLLAIPYPQEINDIPAIMAKSGRRGIRVMIIDQLEEMHGKAFASKTVSKKRPAKPRSWSSELRSPADLRGRLPASA